MTQQRCNNRRRRTGELTDRNLTTDTCMSRHIAQERIWHA